MLIVFLFSLVSSFMGDVAWLCVSMFTSTFKCVYVWGWRGGMQKGGGGQLIGSIFLKGGKMTIIIFNPPSRYPSEMRFFLFRVRWKQLGTGIEQKVPSDHKQTFRWITSKALPQLLALSYLRKIGSLRAKKMTLFTLAGPLISASYVCCVALATSAALHNRFFEGFLSPAKKGIEREDNNKKKGKTEGTNSSTCRRAVPNQHKWIW